MQPLIQLLSVIIVHVLAVAGLHSVVLVAGVSVATIVGILDVGIALVGQLYAMAATPVRDAINADYCISSL